MFNPVRFKRARVAAHLAQGAMSKLMEVSTSTLRRWERGVGEPTEAQLIIYASANRVAVAWLKTDDLPLTPTAAAAADKMIADDLAFITGYESASERVRVALRGTLVDLIAADQLILM